MGFLGRLFGRRRNAVPDEPTAHRINFTGKGPYAASFGDDCGVVFEDDGETGYFYATNAENTEIYDALHVCDRSGGDGIEPGEQVFIVWNPVRKRAGLCFRNEFQAVFDFSERRGVCRTGFPAPDGEWSKRGHDWDETLTEGLRPG